MTFSKFKIILSGFIVIISSCNEGSQTKNSIKIKEDSVKMETQKAQTNINNNDTLLIDSACAVIVLPDSVQLKKMEVASGDNFETIIDDYNFYYSKANKFLDSVKLKSVKCENKKYLKFINKDKTEELVNLTNFNELWKIYFFSPSKKPAKVEITSISKEYKNYFK